MPIKPLNAPYIGSSLGFAAEQEYHSGILTGSDTCLLLSDYTEILSEKVFALLNLHTTLTQLQV